MDFKEANLFKAVDKFFDEKEHYMMLHKVLHKEKPLKRRRMRNPRRPPRLSLKLIHYAVTDYLASQGTLLLQDGRPVSVNSVYYAGIACHGRQLYDAFRRCKSFQYEKHGLVVKTALAQLVFFRDIIRYGILQYIIDHLPEIDDSMRRKNPRAIRPVKHNTMRSTEWSTAKSVARKIVVVSFDCPLKMC